MDKKSSCGSLPFWLRRSFPKDPTYLETHHQIKKNLLHTVCQEATCPNRFECFSKKVATFLACGNVCSRHCAFCNISSKKTPQALDPLEADHITQAAKTLGLRHIVLTMVTRDDLPDGGASHVASILRSLRRDIPTSTLEVLTSDFQGDFSSLSLVLEEGPDIYNHNVETTASISPKVRDRANYLRSLKVLEFAKKSSRCSYVKSGLMVGLGETKEEVFQTIRDLARIGCDMITIGQYLRPTEKNYPIKRYVTPQEFLEYEEFGKGLGILFMECGPFVRSSYHSKELLERARIVNYSPERNKLPADLLPITP